ncbi:HNH endonuclease [Mucilaginibacter gossypii]|uniref:HNH endonuclease n=1 Tax=Mucilaginibacter gossypii TaxID=551996 RepID=A0A1G8D3K2_9SPHI|nr:HNH endonuclease [Mucilaginibacter gossypii]SDH52113.1 HNH endonuclease [Mucilaginibacter gossypii]
MLNISKKCIYCGNTYTGKDGEHVFPFGLGGQNLYMDCVCEKCNNAFSALELELYQKSFVGLVRSVEGVEGYNPNKRNPAPFKAPVLLIFDEKNNVVFEVGQQVRMQVFIRPQLFKLNKKFYVEADNVESQRLFADTFVKWKKDSGIFITRKKNS